MSLNGFNNTYMQAALDMAYKAYGKQEVPVGAIIVYDNKIIATAHNQCIASSDPIAHAELLVIREAAKFLNTHNLSDCDLYVTLEPCQMCAQAIAWSKIKRLYYGADDPKCGGVVSGARIFNTSSCHHKPEIYSGINSLECKKLMRSFFQALR